MIQRKSKYEYLVSLPASKTNKEGLDELKTWCYDFFGPGGRQKDHRWRYGWVRDVSDNFYFRSRDDAVMFAMRCP